MGRINNLHDGKPSMFYNSYEHTDHTCQEDTCLKYSGNDQAYGMWDARLFAELQVMRIGLLCNQ